MGNTLEKSIFFAGGKIIQPESNDNNKGLCFIKSDHDGSWKVTLDLKISADEAAGIINQFSDFIDVQSADDFEKKYPNQVYFEAFDEKKNSINIAVRNAKLYVLNAFKNQEGGSIVFTMTPKDGVGKTQNSETESKTQNAETSTSNI